MSEANATVREPVTKNLVQVGVEGDATATSAELAAAVAAKVKLMAGTTVSAGVTMSTTPLPAAGGDVLFQSAVLSLQSEADNKVKTTLDVPNMRLALADAERPNEVDITHADVVDFIDKYNTARGTDWEIYKGLFVR